MGGPAITKRRNLDPNDPEYGTPDPDEIPETPLFPLNYQELLRIMKILLKSGLPTSVSFVCGFVSGLICFRFAGKYGTPSDLAGATLGFTWANVFCVGILSSINQGFSILAAQLYGARKYYELGILLQKNIFVIVLTMIPLLLSLCFADVILIAIGLNYEVSIATGIYLKCSIPSVLGLAVFECLKYYLIAQNYFHLQPITQGSLSIVHIFWCYLFVDVLGMPLAGVALAKSITDVSTALMLFLCVKWTGICKDTWVPWNKKSLDKWLPYLKQTLILGANLYIEWMALEMSLFVAGMLNNEYVLGAQGVAVTVMNVFFMLPLGNSVSMQAYIGNAAGEGAVNKGKKFAFVGICINVVLSSLNILIMLIWSSDIAEFFTNDEQTKEVLGNMIFIYAFAHIADTSVSHLSGVLRSLGNEWKVLVSFLTCYMLVGVNFEWIFAVACGFGYKAIWYSTGFGMYLMCGWSIWKVLTLNWEEEMTKIKENHEDEKYVELVEI